MNTYNGYDGRPPVKRVPRKKPYAPDWETIREDGLQYSRIRQLYWFDGKVYDHRSASHNGIVGIGHQLRELIRHEQRR